MLLDLLLASMCAPPNHYSLSSRIVFTQVTLVTVVLVLHSAVHSLLSCSQQPRHNYSVGLTIDLIFRKHAMSFER